MIEIIFAILIAALLVGTWRYWWKPALYIGGAVILLIAVGLLVASG